MQNQGAAIKPASFVLTLLFFVSMSAGGQAPPLEAFAALPAMQAANISPDGQRLAFIAQADENSFVLVSNLSDLKVTAAVAVSAMKPRDVIWANEDTLLLLASETVNFGAQARQVESFAPYGIDLAGEISIRQLLLAEPRIGGASQTFGGIIALQGAQLIGFDRSKGLVLFPRRGADANRILYAVDAKDDRRDELDEGTQNTRGWVVDENAKPRFRVEYNAQRDFFTILRRGERSWEVLVAEVTEIPEMAVHGLDAEGELVVGMRPKDGGRFGLYAMSAETGKIERPLLTDDEFDVAGVRKDPYTNRVVGAQVAAEPPVWFDAELRKHQTDLDEVFRGESPRLMSWSADRSRVIVATQRSDHAPAFYLYDAKAAKVSQIASTNTALDRSKLAQRVPYSFKARDGVEIPGFLTRPLDVEGPTPLVMLPHGGPASLDVGGYDWLAHFLASRGYTVLQPNFRGSGGLGKQWEDAGHGQWGVGVMQHDLTDGVAALVTASMADPARVCIVGASYGGYAALAGAAFTPELYRCAVAIAGVADLRVMLSFERDRAGFRSPTVAYWRQAMGVHETGSANEQLDAASPAQHAERVRAPVLLIHGRDDTVVPLTQSRTMERALVDAGKSVQLVELEGEDHWLSGAKTRLETLQALDTFLAEHLAN
jgi:dipeptidyl aminopeptidase/acylaminoacyl peptidase